MKKIKKIVLFLTAALVIAFCGGETAKLYKNFANAEYKIANDRNSLSASGTKTTQIELGAYISLGKYNGKSIVWRCVGIDEKGCLMLADNIIDTLSYDAMTNDNSRSKSHSRNYKRDTYGSNYWKDSNMRSWLNSTANAGEVKWLCGNPPRNGYVDGNAYDEKAGFLNDFSKAEIAAMKTVTQRSLVSHPEYKRGIYDGDGRSDLELNYDIQNVANNFESAYGENSTEKVFLPDVKQVNTVWKNFGDYYIGKNEQGMGWPYWLRTPVSDCNHDMRYVHNNGTIGRESPQRNYIGVRPAFYLDTDYYVATSGNGTSENPYKGAAPDKKEDDYTVAEPEDDPNREWDVSTEQTLALTLGPYYSADGKYKNPVIPVYTIQKTRSDAENMVIVICGEGYTENQQQKFINDVKKVWSGAMQYEPYRSYADRFNVYALCTASESSFENGGSTFFDVVVGSNNSSSISTNMGNPWKNHIFERCIGPAFIEQIHDAHIPNKTEPDKMFWDDNEQYPPYYYVHNYINQFALIVNTSRNFGDAYTNLPFGFHYFITPSDSYRAPQTFAHELGHGLLGLGDEYMDRVTEQTDVTSLNVACNVNPEQVKWKKLLGFRKTYSCPSQSYGNAFNSSYECLMRDTDYSFCEVCKLQGYKRLSQLVSGKSLYVADPEVKKYTGRYSALSDFADTTYNGYYNFANYRNGALLSGADKNKFGAGMAGEKIELRTIIQNLSDTAERHITMKVWIKRADGSVATTVGGQRLEATQTFIVPVWSEKSKFWQKGALRYDGSDFNSGLESCSMIYQIPSDAVLKDGDVVAFAVIDENGNVLANDDTETQTYANVNIEYRFEDGSEIPNAPKAVIPLAVGSVINWTAAPELFGYTLSKAEGLNRQVSGSGQTVTYYYTKQNDTHIHDYGEVKYTWTGNDTCKAERVCKYDNAHVESETVTATVAEIKAATCKEKGRMRYTATFENAAFATQVKEVDSDFAEHTYGKWTDEIPATTEEFGTKGHYECSVCGKYFDRNGNEITDLRIAKIGAHNVIINGESKFYAEGESVTVTAEDKDGKVFKGWKDASEKIVSVEKKYTFIVTGETTLTAVYEDKPSGGGGCNGAIIADSGKSGFSGGAIAGIVIDSVAVAGIGGFAVLWFAVKKKAFADLGVALKKDFTAIGNFFKTLGAKIKALFTKKK